MSNFAMTSVQDQPRTELHEILGLTGCEVSVNTMPAGAAVPFVHAHKNNEELYGILSGKGRLFIDGEVRDIKAGDWFRISPAGERALTAAADSGITYICIQTKANSLDGYTMTDAVMCENKAPWLK